MKRGSLLCLLGVMLAAPQGVVAQATGRVMGTVVEGATARPLAGVTVNVPGTSIGSLTGADGRFLLTGVPAGEQTVRAQMIGYGGESRTVQVAANEAVTVNFELQAEAVHLEGIVAVGYGTQRARDVTGSVASVRAQDIQTIATPNAIEAIKGRVAGVDIVSAGFKPGDGVRVRVRGTRSMRAANDPLFVVDGIPIPGGIEDFNPSNIQSIEILKDASATAIYGSRGANGVVLITTNRGSRTGTRITYDTYYGVQNTRNDIPMMTGPEFAALKREAYRTPGRYQCPEGTDMRVGCPQGDQALFLPQELAGIQSGTSTDWQDLIKQTGSQMEHNVNVSGGNEQTRFTVSGSFFDQQGITRGMSFERTQGAASIDHRVGRLTLGSSLNVSQGIRNHGPGDGIWGQALSHSPLGAPFNEDGTPNPQPIPDGLLWNPVLTIDNVLSEETRNRVFGSIWAELELAPGISLRSNFGPDLLHRTWGSFAGSASGNHRNSGNANANLFRDHRRAYTLSNFLTIDREIGDHRFNSTLLYEVQAENRSENETSVAQLPYEHQRWHNVGSAGQITNVWSRYQEWLLQSFMGRINYGLRDKYLLTLTGRLDGSSRLAEGNKYSFFPSVAVAWRLGDEDFMQEMGVFDDLKLRVSYGLTGNTSIDPYQTQGSLLRTVYSFDGQGAFGYRPFELANPALEWEKTRSLDVGVDFAILQSRITGSADFYVQNTFDLLMSRQLPITSGFGSVLENIGETKNTGVELSLSTINLDNARGLSWSTDISWTRNRNEIVSLYGGKDDDVGSRWFIGQPIDVYYNYKFAGIWQENEREQAALNNQRPGDIKVVDLNGDGRITGDDRMIIGRHERHPAWYGSLNNRFQFGRFDLSALAVARWGYTLSSDFHDGNNTLFGRYNNIRTNYWTPENPSNVDPRPNADQERPLYNDSRRYKDGSHVRIRHVRLGYRVPEAVINRMGGQSLQIYATAQEPHLFTKYDGFDPESDRSGGTGAGSPSYRTLLIGASVGF